MRPFGLPGAPTSRRPVCRSACGVATCAGGVTEGGKSGASKDDRRKVAGHAKERQTEKYDRDQLEAFRRTMKSRTEYRAKNGS